MLHGKEAALSAEKTAQKTFKENALGENLPSFSVQLDNKNSNINIIDCMCMKKKHMGIIFDEIDGVSSGEKSGISEISNIIFEKGVNFYES